MLYANIILTILIKALALFNKKNQFINFFLSIKQNNHGLRVELYFYQIKIECLTS